MLSPWTWSTLPALKADPRVAPVQVILLAILDDQRRGFALGAVDHLTKPIDRKRLLKVLNSIRRSTVPTSVVLAEDSRSHLS